MQTHGTGDRDSRRRGLLTAATATSLVISLIGGMLVLLFPRDAHRPSIALKPIEPTLPTTVPVPTPTPDAGDTDLSMFGFGSDSSSISTPRTTIGGSADLLAGPAGFGPGAPAGSSADLPALDLPGASQLPQMPDAAPFDWNALLAPLVQAQQTAQAASITNSVIGTGAGVVNAAAVAIGDAILFALIANNGQNLLSSLQTALAAPATAAAIGSLNLPAPPDLTGLTTAFAAAATAPPLGVPALPALPALPFPPPPELNLPSPDQLAAALAGLGAIGAIGLPGLPPPPDLPRPEDVIGGVVGGVVAAAVVGAVLGAVFQPPSITRMLGLPF